MVKVKMLDTKRLVEVSRGEAHTLIEGGRAKLFVAGEESDEPIGKKSYKHRMVRAKD